MWKAYGKSLFRKRNSIEVGEYFIRGEKEKIRRYIYIRHVESGRNISIHIYIYARHEVINFIESRKRGGLEGGKV